MQMTVGELLSTIEAQIPATYESPFAKSVMGEDFKMARGKPWWTGWKSDAADLTSNRVPSDIVEVPNAPIGFVSQWVCFVGPSDKEVSTLSVNLPDMNCEMSKLGGTFAIGTERVYNDTPTEELEKLVEFGYAKLMEFVAAEKAKAQ